MLERSMPPSKSYVSVLSTPKSSLPENALKYTLSRGPTRQFSLALRS